MITQLAAQVTQQLIDLHAQTTGIESEKSKVEINAAELWCVVLDNKVYKDEGFKSVQDYIKHIGAGITRQYVYNLADCHRCGPVRDLYVELGPQKAIIIAKAYKRDEITWDDAKDLASKIVDQGYTVAEVKHAVKTLVEINSEGDAEENTVDSLLDKQAALEREKAKLMVRIEDIDKEIDTIQARLAELAQ
jgi:hypothetical protein